MRVIFSATKSQGGELESETIFSKVIFGARIMFHANNGTINHRQLSQRSSSFIASRPIPRIPNCQHVEDQADHDQEFVISRWIGWQPNDVEKEKERGGDDVCPAVDGLG